jgi:hypothetical protein
LRSLSNSGPEFRHRGLQASPLSRCSTSPRSRMAERFMKSIRPSAFRPITPAVTGQHRIEQPPPRLGRCVLFDQRVALALQLPRHLVEQLPQHRDLVIARSSATRTSRSPCPTRCAAPAKPPHGPRQAFGEPQAQPDRGQDHDHAKPR